LEVRVDGGRRLDEKTWRSGVEKTDNFRRKDTNRNNGGDGGTATTPAEVLSVRA